jgi:hypothetical protein
MKINECMKRNVVSISSSATIRQAAERFIKEVQQFTC